jgi:hypothetical protein
LKDCPFWCQVEELWRHESGESDFRRFQNLRLALHRYRRLPGLLRQDATQRNPDFAAYIALNRVLLGAVHRISGNTLIVDSSKEPARLLALGRIDGLDLRVLHLTRDPRGVAWSRCKTALPDPTINIHKTVQGQAAWRTAAFWSVINVATEVAVGRVARGRSLRLRYEDLMADPARHLARIGELADLDLNAIIAGLADGLPIAAAHTVAGNRLRMQKAIELKLDDAWREKLPTGARWATTALTAPLLLRYGYPLAVPPHD